MCLRRSQDTDAIRSFQMIGNRNTLAVINAVYGKGQFLSGRSTMNHTIKIEQDKIGQDGCQGNE